MPQPYVPGGPISIVSSYHVHLFQFLGHPMRLGSVELTPYPDHAADLLWELLASDLAKELVGPSVLSEAVNPA